jgi:hypothetical protein
VENQKCTTGFHPDLVRGSQFSARGFLPPFRTVAQERPGSPPHNDYQALGRPAFLHSRQRGDVRVLEEAKQYVALRLLLSLMHREFPAINYDQPQHDNSPSSQGTGPPRPL